MKLLCIKRRFCSTINHMLAIVYAGAVFAAMFNAAAAVIQRIATAKPDARRLFSHRFAYEMIRSRLFLFGLLLQVIAFAAQAIALKNGPLIIVEPLLTCDLVFLLVLIHWKLGIHIKPRDLLAVGAIILGLTGIFAATKPTGGHLNYSAEPWIILVSVITPITIVLALVVRHLRSANLRALFAGTAAASAYAMNAAFIKLSLNQLNRHGIAYMLTSWPIFAFILSGIASLYLMLNAYGAGPLAVSQPVMEVFEPTIAVIIGIMIFGDSYDSSFKALALALICALLLIGGIITLGSSPRIQEASARGI